jgi:hypothetical protein
MSNYLPSDESLKFISFIRAAGVEDNANAEIHYKLADKYFSTDRQVLIEAFRGSAKSTMMEWLVIYIAALGELPGFGKVNFIAFIGDSAENGVKNLRKNIEFRWENSSFLQEHIPVIKFTDVRLEFKNKDGRKFVVKMYGAKTGVRGAKEMGMRPQLAVLDDLISDEDARSATVISSIEDTVHKAVSKALHPSRQKTVWLGTPFNQKDPLYKAVESGAWDCAVFPICEQFDGSTTRETFKGSWEERFDYDYVKDQYDSAEKQGKLDGFYQELMLRIVSQEDRVIQDEDIVWFEYADIKEQIPSLNIYITTDFATSEKA